MRSTAGCSFDNLDESPPHEFSAALKELAYVLQTSLTISYSYLSRPAGFKLYIPLQLLPMVTWIGTPAFRRTIVELIPSTNVKSVIKLIDIMHTTAYSVFLSKQEAMKRGEDAGKDVTSILRKCTLIYIITLPSFPSSQSEQTPMPLKKIVSPKMRLSL